MPRAFEQSASMKNRTELGLQLGDGLRIQNIRFHAKTAAQCQGLARALKNGGAGIQIQALLWPDETLQVSLDQHRVVAALRAGQQMRQGACRGAIARRRGGPHKARKPGCQRRQMRPTHPQGTLRCKQIARQIAKHRGVVNRYAGVIGKGAGVAERGAAGSAARIVQTHLMAVAHQPIG